MCALLLAPLSLAQADTKAQLAELRAENNKLDAELNALKDAVPELVAAEQKSIKATTELHKAMDTSPALAEETAQQAAAFKKMTEAVMSKDDAARNAAREAHSKASAARLEKATKLPELAELFKASTDAQTEYQRLNKTFRERPDVKAIEDKQKELREKIKALRKS
ncbi:hypothetical protein DB346_17075 [Verrucomicrobia bacterium LW23]|nr:hypothetical protein DB346_17075 [Verrucomicrobia bacterium LW23]